MGGAGPKRALRNPRTCGKVGICDNSVEIGPWMTATSVFYAMGLFRRACIRGFWPLFFVRLVTEVELDPLQLVLLGTVMELSILLSEIPTGVVADVYSRKWSVILSFLIVGSAIVLSANAVDYRWLIVSQVLVGFGSTFESGAETAWITGEVGSADAAEPLILRRAGWQLLTAIIGIVGFGLFAAATSLSVSLTVIGVAYAAWGLVLIVAMPETAFERSAGAGWSGFRSMLSEGWRQSRRRKPLWILATAVFVGGLAKEAIDRLDIQRLVDIGLPDDLNDIVVIAVLVAAKSVFAAGALVIARRRARGGSVVMAMVLLFTGIAGGIALLAHVELLAVAGLGLILQGGFALASEPLVTTWTNMFASGDARATVHSFIGQGEAFGEILGGVALGSVAQLTTVPTAMTVSALLFLVAAAVAFTAVKAWDSVEVEPLA